MLYRDKKQKKKKKKKKKTQKKNTYMFFFLFFFFVLLHELTVVVPPEVEHKTPGRVTSTQTSSERWALNAMTQTCANALLVICIIQFNGSIKKIEKPKNHTIRK